jgi:hypothetical protein
MLRASILNLKIWEQQQLPLINEKVLGNFSQRITNYIFDYSRENLYAETICFDLIPLKRMLLI